MARKDFRAGDATGKREALHSGARRDCLADALAEATGDANGATRDYLGEDRSLDRARAYVAEVHPTLRLDDASSDFMNSKGGVAWALLSRTQGRFVLQQTYAEAGETKRHCTFFDAGLAWGPVEVFDEHGTRIVKAGRGVFKDNQTDVKVHLAEASDRQDKLTARAFFAHPYPGRDDMRIARVYELVSAEEASRRDARRAQRKAAEQRRAAEQRKAAERTQGLKRKRE